MTGTDILVLLEEPALVLPLPHLGLRSLSPQHLSPTSHPWLHRFNDILSKIKKAPKIGTNSGPRERSPARGAQPERKPHWTRLLQPDGRTASMKAKGPLIYKGTRRKREDEAEDPNPPKRRPPPKPSGRLRARKPRVNPQPPLPPPPKPPPPPPPSTAGKKMARNKN